MLILGRAIEQEDVPEDASLVGRISNVTQVKLKKKKSLIFSVNFFYCFMKFLVDRWMDGRMDGFVRSGYLIFFICLQSVKAGRLVSTAIRLVEIVNTWNIATMSQVYVRMGVFLGIMDYAAHMNNVNQILSKDNFS